jgi:hypothetical protein
VIALPIFLGVSLLAWPLEVAQLVLDGIVGAFFG